MKASDAFDEFQESRVRDAVYGYLGTVFEVVEHYRLRGRTKSLLRRAFKFADLPHSLLSFAAHVTKAPTTKRSANGREPYDTSLFARSPECR